MNGVMIFFFHQAFTACQVACCLLFLSNSVLIDTAIVLYFLTDSDNSVTRMIDSTFYILACQELTTYIASSTVSQLGQIFCKLDYDFGS